MFRSPETKNVMHGRSIAVLDESENPDDCVGENTGITDNFTDRPSSAYSRGYPQVIPLTQHFLKAMHLGNSELHACLKRHTAKKSCVDFRTREAKPSAIRNPQRQNPDCLAASAARQ